MKRRILAVFFMLCLSVSLLPAAAMANNDSTAEYQGLTISCAEGNIADKVKLENAGNGGGGKRDSIVIKQAGTYTISGTWDTSIWDGYANLNAVLIVEKNIYADITLDNVTIRADEASTANPTAQDKSGIRCKSGSEVTLRLSGQNSIHGQGGPAIEVEGTADVTITGNGSLEAVCGENPRNSDGGYYPGIGVWQTGGGTLTISGGTIESVGGKRGGAGIGDNGKAGAVLKKIIIEEEPGCNIDLTATGGRGAPGIGSLSSSSSVSNTQILIRSGKITARAGAENTYGSAGIGGGDNWIASSVDPGDPDVQIEITGGDITAVGTGSGAGIGGGNGCAPTIRITGGTIHATGGSWAAGIGAGTSGNDGSIEITGGEIMARGGSGGAGIGGGWYGSGTDVTIGGTAILTAIGSGKGEGIGAGNSGSAGAVTFDGSPQVLAGSSSGLAVNENATASGCAVLNGQFMDTLPASVSVVDGTGSAIKEIDSIPAGLKSVACTLPDQAQTVRVGREDGTFACTSEGGQDVFDWNMQPSQVLTRTGLIWKEASSQEPVVRFKVTHQNHTGLPAETVEIVENGATITWNRGAATRVDIVPIIEHPQAGTGTGNTFFWYKWADSTGQRNEVTDGEDFTFGETINTVRISQEAHARTGDDCYYIEIQGKIVSGGRPSYGWDGDPIYTSAGQTYHIHVNVIDVENLWEVYGPDRGNLDKIYQTADEVIQDYLKQKFAQVEVISDRLAEESLSISWELKPGTEYSALPNAENVFVWSASDAFAELGWTNSKQIPLDGEVTLKNPDIVIPDTYRITATAGPNGTISPKGSIAVEKGKDQLFTITPSAGYRIEDVLVDGNSVGAVSSYTFTNVTANRTITATFAQDSSGDTDPAPDPGTPDDYTLYYHSNFGSDKRFYQSEDDSRMKVRDYEDMSFLPEREGYTFRGWNTKADGSGKDYWPGDTFQVSGSSAHLYAQWSKDGFTPVDTGVSRWLNTKDHIAYLSGYGTGLFGPDNRMTRAQAAQMFYNLLLDRNVSVTSSFTDVSADTWCYDAVSALSSMGIIQGYQDGTFRPNQPITRAQFAAIVTRFAGAGVPEAQTFTDVPTDYWAYDAISAASGLGWITGYDDGTFRPDATVTRAQVAVIVNRMLGRSADEDYVNSYTTSLSQFVDLTDTHWAYYDIMEAANAHDYEKNGGAESWLRLR